MEEQLEAGRLTVATVVSLHNEWEFDVIVRVFCWAAMKGKERCLDDSVEKGSKATSKGNSKERLGREKLRKGGGERERRRRERRGGRSRRGRGGGGGGVGGGEIR